VESRLDPADDWTRRVLIVDDDAFISGLVTELVAAAGFTPHVAHTAHEALDVADDVDPDAAILDIELGPGPNGFDLADALLARMPHLAIVFLTQVAGPDLIHRTASIPTQAAYLVKRDLSDAQVIVRALEHVLRDEDPRPEFRADERRNDPLTLLTPQQLETLRLVAEGLSNEEIAVRRETSVRAVEAMVSRVFTILEVNNDHRINPRVAATRLYLEHGASRLAAEESA
jgi:DNA-binding NarL/FixJ family response regulator